MEFTKINNDVNGNPRYVVHFLDLETSDINGDVLNRYNKTVDKYRCIGARKYNTKKYGGGVVFQTYNLESLKNEINQIKNRNNNQK